MPVSQQHPRRRGTMASGGSRASVLALAALLMVSGCQAPDVGRAVLRNESGMGDLEVAVIDPQGRSGISGTMVETFYFDTRFMDRELQCLVAEDGHLEVHELDGDLVVSHDFADRAVCEHDVIVLGPDGSLTWE